MTVLADRYRQLIRQPSDIYEHLPTLRRAVLELGATRVIELGVRSGVSTIAWLYGLEETGGHLWSVDLERPSGDLLRFPPHHWTFVQGSDTDSSILAQLPDQVDIVFIDTDHTYDRTWAELTLYGARVRNGGRILLHDTELAEVRLAIEDYCRMARLDATIADNCHGLGTIYA